MTKTAFKIIFLIIGLGFIVAICWLLLSNGIGQPFSQEKNESPQEENIKNEAVLVINKGEGDLETFTIELKNSTTTAFNLLENKAEELNFVLKTKMYDFGIFIEAIGDKENGQDEKYWMYYVNDEMPMAAADKEEIGPGDKVEFKFEKPSF